MNTNVYLSRAATSRRIKKKQGGKKREQSGGTKGKNRWQKAMQQRCLSWESNVSAHQPETFEVVLNVIRRYISSTGA